MDTFEETTTFNESPLVTTTETENYDDEYNIITSDNGDDDDITLNSSSRISSDTEDEMKDTNETENFSKRASWSERVNMLHLRRYLESLNHDLETRDYQLQDARAELEKCKERISELEKDLQIIYAERERFIIEGNKASEQLHDGKLKMIEKSLYRENKLMDLISLNVETSEYDVAKCEVEIGRYQIVESDLKQKEEIEGKHQLMIAKERRFKESNLRIKSTKKRLQYRMMQRQEEVDDYQRHQNTIEKTKKVHKKMHEFVQFTIDKIRKRVEEEEIQEKTQVTKRMDAIINLKNNITATRENIQAMQAKDAALATKRKQLESRRNLACLEQGGNVAQMNARQQILSKHANSLRKHKSADKERKIEIVEKLLQEEENMKKRVDLYPFLFDENKFAKDQIIKKKTKKKLKVLETMIEYENYVEPKFEIDQSKFDECQDSDDSDENLTNFMTKENTMIINTNIDESEIIVKPEFEGLWKDHRPYKAPNYVDQKPIGGSHMQKEIHSRNLEIQRENIVHTQVAAGREFKGQASFNSKPEVVHFKDFDVGKTYKKKMILTNVSYTVNYCKFIGITEHLKDFIEISFDSPGQLSAGLTCDLHVQFKPMINEDLQGEIKFLTETGTFNIDLICTIKKCDLTVSSCKLDYGIAVIGESVTKSFTLRNNGALATKFSFYKISALKDFNLNSIDEASILRSTIAPESVIDTSADRQTEDNRPSALNSSRQTQGAGSSINDQTMALSKVNETDYIEIDDLLTDGFAVIQPQSSVIGAFSSLRLEVQWQPLYSGKVDSEFIVTFSDETSQNICIETTATAIELPVWVSRENVDLRICMLDRLYQDTIVLNNRASTALKLKFEVCNELKQHLELLPKTGYIQANSKFSAQLKFIPRNSLFTDNCPYFDTSTGVLEAPMIISVADQTRPVNFTVHAIVTNSDLEFDSMTIDFGHVTIHEMCRHTLQMTSKSILPQEYGFPGCPEYVEVQPGDGFGTLLPLESLNLDILFMPKKAGEYNFTLTCKTLVDREFRIVCKGIGVHTPLSLSHRCVRFAATTLYDQVQTLKVTMRNDHTDINEFSHPVPRIGKGPIVPVGITSFCFKISDDIPLKISPSVGCIQPGKKQTLMLTYKPTLSGDEIRETAVQMIAAEEADRLEKEYQSELAAEQAELLRKSSGQKKDAKGKPAAKTRPSNEANSPVITVKPPQEVIPKNKESIVDGSDDYIAAQSALTRNFPGTFQTFVLPCFIASGNCEENENLDYSEHNTIYLEVHCPAIRPELVVISDKGRTKTDFNRVSIGQSVLKPVTVQNISDKSIQTSYLTSPLIKLTASCLDTSGTFSVQNSLRLLKPGESHSMLIRFTPLSDQVFQEYIEIYGRHSKLTLTLEGQGQMPIVSLSIDGGCMDLGSILMGEYREEPFKINNMSKLAVQYKITIDSNSLNLYSESQQLPSFLGKENKSLIGVPNNNGLNVFDCVPIQGTIEAGMSQEVMVTFAPDHISDLYSDGIHIHLFGGKESYAFQLKGQVKPHIMFISGGEQLSPSIESLALKMPSASSSQEVPDKSEKRAKSGKRAQTKPTPRSLPSKPLLVNLLTTFNDDGFQPAVREITVGCVRTMAVSQKKDKNTKTVEPPSLVTNGEFIFENLPALAVLGFTVEPSRGMIEAPNKKQVTITWNLPPRHNLTKCIEATLLCTLKSDVTEQVPILLRALVLS